VGQGTNNVVLSYQPASVSIGLIVSIASLVILLALFASGIPWRRTRAWLSGLRSMAASDNSRPDG
jgi:hypothetical protein